MTLIQTGLTIILIVSSFFLSANEQQLNTVVKEQIQNHKQEVIAQKKILNLSDKTYSIIDKYLITLDQIENTKNYNKHTKILLQHQTDEIKSIYSQIVEVKKTGKQITPLILKMTKNLEKFISLDIPFLLKERTTRLKEIKKIINRADVSVSEKYRRLVEAYQIENIYGKTIETYEGIQNIKNKKLTVHYLRMGRLVLIYQTMDTKYQGYWDQNKKTWIPLSSRYSKSIKRGIKTAKKQQAPTLLIMPVPSPIKVSVINKLKKDLYE